MSAPLDCPEIDCWQALLDDTVSADQRERCERHLETCLACQDRLDHIEDCGESLRELAEQVGDPTLVAADPSMIQVLQRLLETRSPERTSRIEPADLYFLQPGDRPDLLGTLGDYEVRRVIGQGGMGIVLEAFEPALHRVVAIKVLSAAIAGSATARRRFTREAHAAAAVSHDHIVPVHGVYESDGVPYLVMQYVSGESLQHRLDREGALDVEEIVRIGLQTAQGLAAAHAQGLIHRDIKPANLLLSSIVRRASFDAGEETAPEVNYGQRTRDNGLVKITDFGLARMVDDVQLTRDGVVAGTPEYMAPEQARAETVDHRADLFSLGSVLYACCTGTPPFRGSSAVAVLRQVSDETPRSIRALNPAIPAWLETLIARLMAKQPADRFQGAAEIAELLEGCLAHLRQPATVPAPEICLYPDREWVEATDQESRPHPGGRWPLLGWLALLLITTVLGASSILGLLLQSDHVKPPVKENVEPGDANHVAFDFRKEIEGLPPCTLIGPDSDALAKTDDRGLRFSLKEGRQRTNLVGVDVPIWLRGDFDINFGYHILKMDGAVPKYGKSLAMRVMFGEPPHAVTALISRTRKPHGDFFERFKLVKEQDGKDQYQENKTIAASKLFGRLRLVRTGSLLHYLAADGVAETQELRSLEIGTDDVRMVRLYATTDFKPVPFDLRFTDLDIRADQILGQSAGAEPSSTTATVATGSKVALVSVLVIALFLALASMLGLWLHLRRTRRDRQPAAAPMVSFACAGCGKTLKARPELAGKKIKCPQCGEAGSVPAITSATLTTSDPRSGKPTQSKPVWPLLACVSLGVPALLVLLWIGYGFIVSESSPIPQTQTETASVQRTRRLRGHTGPVHDVRFTSNGRLVSASGWPQSDRSLRIWDVATGQEMARIETAGEIHSLDLTSDGQFALVGLQTGEIQMFDLDARRLINSLKGHGRSVDSVAFAPDGKLGFSASTDGTARMWDLETATQRARFRVAGKWARCCAPFLDGRRLLTGDNDGVLQIWDLSTRQEIKRIAAGPWIIDSLILLPDNKQALIAGVDGLRLMDLETGETVRKFQAEQEEVYRAALSPDGRLLTAGFDGVIRLWNYQTAELIRELGRHQGFAFSVAFSPDGRTAASGGGGERHDGKYLAGTDHDIRLWDVAAPTASQAARNDGWLTSAVIFLVVIASTILGMWYLVHRARRLPA